MRKLIALICIFIGIVLFWNGAKLYLPQFFRNIQLPSLPEQNEKVKIITEESVIIDVVKTVKPSVVTVAEELPLQDNMPFRDPFRFFTEPDTEVPLGPQNIGSAFVVSEDGLIVTNKHVVANPGATYKIITGDDKKYDVKKIYRDSLNDVAILKIDPSQNPNTTLKSVSLGDSSNLQVGQLVVAIGTPLGQFANTVTSGIVSGLGRGITAGSQFEGTVEQLDNVIQTDAAINPGNSGGPLVNSSGQVIGVNTAIAQSGQNIGFALPINVIKESIKNFNESGQFERAYLGVSYVMIDQDTSVNSSLPQGAYIRSVVNDSPAEKAGLKIRDVIIKLDGTEVVSKKNELSTLIAKKKIGDTIKLLVWRREGGEKTGKTLEVSVTLGKTPSQ